jgi:hypothetical protein
MKTRVANSHKPLKTVYLQYEIHQLVKIRKLELLI